MKKAYDAYTTASVDTASQGKLILIAYDIAIKSCKAALEEFSNHQKIDLRTKSLFKAQDAITELMGALRMEAGDIAQNLYKLYDYMLRKLVESNVKNDPGKTKEVLGYLENLRDAWSTAIEKIKRDSEPAVPMTKEHGFAISG
jgi:flagellar secretion chaperone FliS